MEEKMKKVTLCVLALLMAAYAFCQPWDGPFGLKMGLTFNQLKAVDPGIEKLDENNYKMTKVPKPHRDLESYYVTISPTSGLAKVGALSANISSNGYGFDVRSKYESLRDALAEKYGEYKEIDMLMPGSIWDDPDDFMMALLMKDRYLFCLWGRDNGSTLPSYIYGVALSTTGLNSNTAYLSLVYEFSNYAMYIEELKIKDSGSL